MAPVKASQGRRSLAPQRQSQQFYELGKQGRKTGITLPDTGIRDEHGMEPMDGIFSSPSKVNGNDEDDEDEDDSEGGEAPMDLTTASGPFPALNGARLPVPRSKSPRKTNFNSPATRNIFRGDHSSSPTNTTGALAASASRPVKRRLDFNNMESQLNPKAVAAAKASQQSSRGAKPGPAKGRAARAQEIESEEEEQEEVEDEQEDQSDHHDSGVVGGDDSMQIIDTEAPNDYSIESEEDEDIPAVSPKGKRRRSGRHSLNDDETAEPAADEAPRAKRAKTDSQPKGRKPGPAPKEKAPVAAVKGKANAKAKAVAPATNGETAPKKRGRKPKVAAEEVGESSELNIKQGPALPRVNKGLLIARQNLSDATRTRSGRASFKPVAYWKNEYVEYEKDIEEDHFTHTGPSRFVLPSVKEIHRVEEPEPPSRPKSYNRGGRSGKKRKAVEEDDEPLEPWEEDPGQILGEVRVWQPEHEAHPPLPDDPIDYAEVQLALAGNAVVTKPVANATFRFAKTLNLPFFGSGIVDLPPGAEKTQKNARRMQMVFMVQYGKVTVTVGETEFRIGKGGMWFVPRGNYYGIRNDSDSEDARVFFAQGCEVSSGDSL